MNELLVVISAELILLAAVAAMMIHSRRADVLSRHCPDEVDYSASDSARAGLARWRFERDRLWSQALLLLGKLRDYQGGRGAAMIRKSRADTDKLANRQSSNGA
jgi:hypothetical protein